MPQYCAVPQCFEKKGGHKFPRDKQRLKCWLAAIRRNGFVPSEHSRVCKKHFNAGDYELPKDSFSENPRPLLRKDAVPRKFPWNEATYDALLQKKEERAQRALQRDKKKKEYLERQLVEPDVVECPGMEIEVEAYEICNDNGTQCNLCNCDLKPHDSGKSNKNTIFSIDNLINVREASEVRFYTGFDDYDHFEFVFNLFGDEVNYLKYYPTMNHSNPNGKRMLNPCNEFLLTIVKLRRNMTMTELSIRFKICKTTVSNTFITWVNYLYCKFKDLNMWAPKDIIDNNMKLRGKDNPCTIIIDCTEIKIDKPKNPVSQQLTYSNYKSCNTLKVLVGISASGSVTFVSDAYGGSISDRELFEKCGLVDLLQRNDIILGDRGFNIQDLVCHKDITVNVPEFLHKNDSQFETHQLRKSKIVSSNRIHVERIIGLGKTYKILSNRLQSTLVPLADRIVFVCFMLTNFRCNIII